MSAPRKRRRNSLAAEQVALLDLLEPFAAVKLADRDAELPHFQSAVGWLSKAIGKPATLADLSRDNLAAALDFAARSGIGRLRLKTIRTQLGMLWSFAHACGLAGEFQSVSLPSVAANTASSNGQPGPIDASQDNRGVDRSSPPPAALEPITLDDPPPPGTLRDYLEREYIPQRLIGAGDRAADDHRCTLRLLCHFARRDVLLSQLDNAFAAKFFQSLLKHGAKPVTVNGHRARLFALWRFAHEEQRLTEAPRVRRLKEHKPAPDAWSEDEMRRILAAVERVDYPDTIGGASFATFWRAVLLVCWYTGLRRRSLFALQRADFDRKTGWLLVRPEGIKTLSAKRFRLGADAIAAVNSLADELDRQQMESAALFPWPFTVGVLNDHFGRILDAAGIAVDKTRSTTKFNKLRRSVATITAARQGLAAAIALLDHSGPEVTRRYLDTRQLPGNDATQFLPQLTEVRGSNGEGR